MKDHQKLKFCSPSTVTFPSYPPWLSFTSSHIFRLSTLKGTTIPLTEVMLDFSTLRGTKPRTLTPKRYNDHPCQVYMGVPPRVLYHYATGTSCRDRPCIRFNFITVISCFLLALMAYQAGHLLTRNHGNPDSKDTPPQFPLVQNQCIDCERFRPLFECLTNWGTGEIGPTLAQRAFKVSTFK